MTDKLIEALEETRDTLAKVLIKVRRDAPDLSGKLLGHADQVIARADALLDAQAHRSQQESASPDAKGVEVAVVESLGGPQNLPQLLWYVDFPNMAALVKPGDKLYISPAPSESEARRPLTDAAIRDESGKWINQPDHISSPDPFKAGVRWAEKQHGIDAALSASVREGES